MYASDIDPILAEYSDYIEEWGYVTNKTINYYNLPPNYSTLRNAYVEAFSPSKVLNDFLLVTEYNHSTSLPPID